MIAVGVIAFPDFGYEFLETCSLVAAWAPKKLMFKQLKSY